MFLVFCLDHVGKHDVLFFLTDDGMLHVHRLNDLGNITSTPLAYGRGFQALRNCCFSTDKSVVMTTKNFGLRKITFGQAPPPPPPAAKAGGGKDAKSATTAAVAVASAVATSAVPEDKFS